MASSRKTRSQLALPDIDPDILGRSPLKAARTALKHNVNATPPVPSMSSTPESSQDCDVPAKRPSSPLKDTVALRERDLKRAKHEGLSSDNENESTRPATYPPHSPKKPSSSSSVPSVSAEYTPIKLQRASSVPPETATPIPHLDLNRIPPSPWRTPAIKLRITTVSSMDSIADTTVTIQDSTSNPDVVMDMPEASSSALPVPAEQMVDVAQKSESLLVIPASDVPPPSSPMSSIPTSPLDEQPPMAMLPVTPRRDPQSSSIPMSPLTPLPSTPWVHKSGISERVEEKRPDTEANANLRPKTPVASGSRLPRLSAMPQLSAPSYTSVKPEIKPKAPSRARAMKTKQASAPIPLGGRMTRSASLRHQETKKKEDIAVVVPSAKQVTRPNASLGAPSIPSVPPSAAKTPGRRRSTSFSYAMPTSSSVAKSNPGSPAKPHSSAIPSSTVRPFMFSRASQPPPSSSLANLHQAIEKLNLPPPSRPNTSMGFNRNAPGGDTDDEDDTPAHSTKSKDDGDIAMRSNGSGSSLKRPAIPLKRSATLGSVSRSIASSSKPPAQMHSKLMLPPPVPKAKLTSTSSSSLSSTSTGAPKKINLHSGIVSGKPKGAFAFGKAALPNKPRMFGVGTFTGGVGHGRSAARVSKPSSLPVVEGSPAKGGGGFTMDITSDEPMDGPSSLASDEVREVTNDKNMFTFGVSSGEPSGALTNGAVVPTTSEGQAQSPNNQQAKPADSWKSNASRRASLASHLLSQSLSSMPETPPRPVAPSSEGKGKGRAGLRSSSSTYPSAAQQGMHTAPGALGKAGSSNGDGAHVSKTKPNGASSSSESSTSLKVLKDCTIFVDVRTDDGDDAGGLFVDMLRGMGARMLTRVGQTCTHIVYKNGLMSTLTKYKSLHEPQPHVVGIAWVVECAEQRVKVDEKKFLVDLEYAGIAGGSKRRRSMLPKTNMIPRDLSPEFGSADAQDGDRSMESTSSYDSPNGADDGLTPLERARRRNNTIKNMFARAS